MMEAENNYQVLLYYKFVPIPKSELEELQVEHMGICEKLELKGRIFIAEEGINGTVSGLKKDTDKYMDFMQNHTYFGGTEFKIDTYHTHAFLKLFVRIKNEIVHLAPSEKIEPWNGTAKYIEPEEFREILRNPPEDVVILDARSNYEHEMGKFKNAVTLNIDNFREIFDVWDEIEQYKDKKVITYCTGGIKCEKLTSIMLKAGFRDLYQLHGGIIRYGLEAGGENFDGICYVFDDRVVTNVNSINPTMIGDCKRCGTKTNRIINCANALCNIQYIVCDECADKYEGCCSELCEVSPQRRKWNSKGLYHKGIDSKDYVEKVEL